MSDHRPQTYKIITPKPVPAPAPRPADTGRSAGDVWREEARIEEVQ